MRHLILISALVLIAACGSADNELRSTDREIHDLVDQVVLAHGGRDAMSQIHGYVATGKLHALQRNTLIRTTRWFQRPDRLLLELDYPTQPEWRLTLSKQSWKGSTRSDLRPAKGPVIWSMRLQTARFDLPLRLLEHEAELTLVAPDASGRPVLSHNLDEGLRVDYHIDPKTHLVEKVTMAMTGPPTIEFEADYSGYRKVAGVMMPHREVTRAGGTVTSRVVIDTFVVNPPDLSKWLAFPGGSL